MYRSSLATLQVEFTARGAVIGFIPKLLIWKVERHDRSAGLVGRFELM